MIISSFKIKNNEKIKRGDVKKVIISSRKAFTVNEKVSLDELQYRLYVKEGKAEVTVVDYTDVEQAFNNNYFLLDTQSLVPNTYTLDVRMVSNLETTTYKDVLSFDITNQVSIRR